MRITVAGEDESSTISEAVPKSSSFTAPASNGGASINQLSAAVQTLRRDTNGGLASTAEHLADGEGGVAGAEALAVEVHDATAVHCQRGVRRQGIRRRRLPGLDQRFKRCDLPFKLSLNALHLLHERIRFCRLLDRLGLGLGNGCPVWWCCRGWGVDRLSGASR